MFCSQVLLYVHYLFFYNAMYTTASPGSVMIKVFEMFFARKTTVYEKKIACYRTMAAFKNGLGVAEAVLLAVVVVVLAFHHTTTQFLMTKLVVNLNLNVIKGNGNN